MRVVLVTFAALCFAVACSAYAEEKPPVQTEKGILDIDALSTAIQEAARLDDGDQEAFFSDKTLKTPNELNQTLTVLFLALSLSETSPEKLAEFRPLGAREVNVHQLLSILRRTHRTDASIAHADYIKQIVAVVENGSVSGRLNLAGQSWNMSVAFEGVMVDGKWRIDKFSMPVRGIVCSRQDNDRWRIEPYPTRDGNETDQPPSSVEAPSDHDEEPEAKGP